MGESVPGVAPSDTFRSLSSTVTFFFICKGVSDEREAQLETSTHKVP